MPTCNFTNDTVSSQHQLPLDQTRMFRRVKPIAHKEDEITFPIDLGKLGYFVNKQDQIRQLEDPSKPFEYHVHRSDRVNERRRESVDECIRRILEKRFVEEGLTKLYLPAGADPAVDRCVPILISDNLATAGKVLIIIGNTYDDLGVWSVREMEGPGINHGSMISTVQTAKAAGFAVVILNCGQNIYAPEMGRAVTYRSWRATSRTSPHIDEVLHRVAGHENARCHVQATLDELRARVTDGGKRVYFLTSGWGCWGVVKYLNQKFDEWKPAVEALIAVESTHTLSDITNPDLAHFLNTRARAYIVHADPLGAFIPDRRFGCQTFSSNQIHSECIIPNSWSQLMLPWLQVVEADPEGCNPVFVVDVANVKESQTDWQEENGALFPSEDGEEDKWAFEDTVENGELESIVDVRGSGGAQENARQGEEVSVGQAARPA